LYAKTEHIGSANRVELLAKKVSSATAKGKLTQHHQIFSKVTLTLFLLQLRYNEYFQVDPINKLKKKKLFQSKPSR
jgi:hypothetical protein